MSYPSKNQIKERLNTSWAMENIPGTEKQYCSNYLHRVFNINDFPVLIDKIAQELKNIEFDAIAFRGTSGSAVGFPLSYVMKKPVVCIRKPGSSHNRKLYEGAVAFKRYIIVDDFCETGSTLKNIRDTIVFQHDALMYHDPICKAIVFYDHPDPSVEIRKKIEKWFPDATILFIDR